MHSILHLGYMGSNDTGVRGLGFNADVLWSVLSISTVVEQRVC